MKRVNLVRFLFYGSTVVGVEEIVGLLNWVGGSIVFVVYVLVVVVLCVAWLYEKERKNQIDPRLIAAQAYEGAGQLVRAAGVVVVVAGLILFGKLLDS